MSGPADDLDTKVGNTFPMEELFPPSVDDWPDNSLRSKILEE